MKSYIDKILNWTISKKLTVFLIATILIFKDKISGAEWIYVALMYIGTQGAIDLYNSIKKK
jgi:hypothetical protein